MSKHDRILYGRCAAGLKQNQLAELVNRVLVDDGEPPTWDGNNLSQFECEHRTITDRSWRLISLALEDVGGAIPRRAPKLRERKGLSTRIRRIRKDLGLRQADVANAANEVLEERGFPATWYEATVGRLEARSEHNRPLLATLGLLCVVFDSYGHTIKLEKLA